MSDYQFNGDNNRLVECIQALLELDSKGAIAPRPLCHDVKVLLSAAGDRIRGMQETIEKHSEPMGYMRQTDAGLQYRDGPECPPNRSGGAAGPWFAVYDRPVTIEFNEG